MGLPETNKFGPKIGSTIVYLRIFTNRYFLYVRLLAHFRPR